MTTLRQTFMEATRRGSWKTVVRISGTSTSPPSGASRPARTRSMVVLPLPDAPSRATNSPRPTVKSMPASTRRPSKDLVTTPRTMAARVRPPPPKSWGSTGLTGRPV